MLPLLCRVKRKSVLSNIITNYFGTDPFAQEKQKPRLHLPPPEQHTKAANNNNNNNSGSSSFAKRFLVKPLNLRLGPPIKILPTLNRGRPQQPPAQPPPQQQQKQQQRVQPQSSEDVYRASVPAPLLASGMKEQERREIITVRGQSYVLRLPKSKILTPHPPLPPASVTSPPPPNKGGEYTFAGWRGGGGSIFWKTRDIGLPSYSNNLSTSRRVACRRPCWPGTVPPSSSGPRRWKRPNGMGSTPSQS